MGLLTSSRRRMALGLGLALFFILCEVLLTSQSLRRQERSYNWVRHTLQVQMESILSALMQAEEQRLLRQREEAWGRAAGTSIALRLTGSALLLTLAVLAATLSWRGYQTERRMARRALDESWDQLLSITVNIVHGIVERLAPPSRSGCPATRP